MNDRPRGLVFAGGAAAGGHYFNLVSNIFDVFVAADSGLETAEGLAVDVDMVVGDMDSLSRLELLDSLPDCKKRIYEREKDSTDTEIGLDYLWEVGCGYTGIYGGGGGRLDHLIGILSLFDRPTAPDIWITDSNVVIHVKNKLKLSGAGGLTVSFFPVGKEPCEMTSRGLKWPLDELRWNRGDTGVSNEITGSVMAVEMMQGRLICVGPLDMLVGYTP